MTAERVLAIAAAQDLRRVAAADEHLVELWLHGRSPHTQRTYRADVARFLAFVARPLTTVTLGDVQAFSDSLTGLAPSSRTRALAAVKSLLAFGQRTGYLPLNVGAAVKLQQGKDKLAERILSEADVHTMLALEPGRRNQSERRARRRRSGSVYSNLGYPRRLAQKAAQQFSRRADYRDHSDCHQTHVEIGR